METSTNVPSISTYQETVTKVKAKMSEFYDKIAHASQLYREEIPQDWDLINAMLKTGAGFCEADKVAAAHNARKFQGQPEETGR